MLKWQLHDEGDVAQALALRRDALVARTVELHAPVLLAYELTNAIRTTERRMRLDASTAEDALSLLLETGIELHPPDPPAALRLARDLGISGYDAAYVALAAELGVDCWSADERLVRAASRRAPFVRSITAYAAVLA